MNPYETLGVTEDAEKEDIKEAFHKKAKKAHPDKGGTETEMQQLAIAYDILSDRYKRKRYDETKETTPPRTDELAVKIVLEEWQKVIQEATNTGNYETMDMRGLVAKRLERRILERTADKVSNGTAIKRLKKIKERISRKDTEQSAIVEALIDKNIETAEDAMRACVDILEVLAKAVIIHENYEYRQDEPMTAASAFSGMFGGQFSTSIY